MTPTMPISTRARGGWLAAAIGLALVSMPMPASAQAEAPTPPTEFTAELSGCDDTRDPEVVESAELIQVRGFAEVNKVVQASDPRLGGTATTVYNQDSHVDPATFEGPQINTNTLRTENETGAWTGSYHSLFYADGTGATSDIFELVGDGGFDGLVAVVELTGEPFVCEQNLRGVVVPGGAPPVPEAATTE